jgi:hypothetical protein
LGRQDKKEAWAHFAAMPLLLRTGKRRGAYLL